MVAVAIWGADTLPIGVDEGAPKPKIIWEQMAREQLGAYEGVNEIKLNSRRRWHWNILCATVAHEMGHLAGRGHAKDPNALMYPSYHPDHRCRNFGVPYLRQRGYRPNPRPGR